MREYKVVDANDDRILDFVGLNDHKLRQIRERPDGDMASFFIGEGVQVVKRALEAKHHLVSLVMSENFNLSKFIELPDGTEILRCSPLVLKAISGRPDLKDPIALFLRPPIPDFKTTIKQSNIVLLTENVQNPTNMGMIMRNAAAFGIDAVCVDATSCDPYYRRAVRVSMGQVFATPHVRIDSVLDAIAYLHRIGYVTVALTPRIDSKKLSLALQGIKGPIAFIAGSEGMGLTAEVLDSASVKARIPMQANVDSLNVATAVAIALYAVNDLKESI